MFLGGKNIEFSFSTVGRLTIRNGKVKMRFYKEFVGSLEGSEEILNSMRDVSSSVSRPTSVAAVVCIENQTSSGSHDKQLPLLRVCSGSSKPRNTAKKADRGLQLPSVVQPQFEIAKPASPPRFTASLSPLCHGPPKYYENPRERRRLESPSEEQKELLKERARFQHILDDYMNKLTEIGRLSKKK